MCGFTCSIRLINVSTAWTEETFFSRMSCASLVADIQVISVEGSPEVAKLDPLAAPEDRSGSAAANVARAAVRRNPRRSEVEDEVRGRDFMAMISRGRLDSGFFPAAGFTLDELSDRERN